MWERGYTNHYSYPDGVFDPDTLTLLNFPWSGTAISDGVRLSTDYMSPDFYNYPGYMEIIVINCYGQSKDNYYIIDKWITQYGQPRRYWPSDSITALPPTTGTYVSGLWSVSQPYNAVNPFYNTWGNYPTWPPNNSPNP